MLAFKLRVLALQPRSQISGKVSATDLMIKMKIEEIYKIYNSEEGTFGSANFGGSKEMKIYLNQVEKDFSETNIHKILPRIIAHEYLHLLIWELSGEFDYTPDTSEFAFTLFQKPNLNTIVKTEERVVRKLSETEHLNMIVLMKKSKQREFAERDKKKGIIRKRTDELRILDKIISGDFGWLKGKVKLEEYENAEMPKV